MRSPPRRPRVSEFAGVVTGFCAMTWAVVFSSALPGLQLKGVSANSTVSGVVSLSAEATAAGLASIQFQVSNSNVGPQITSGACTTAWDTRSNPDGARTVTVVGRDSAGNQVSATPIVVNVRNGLVDTTAPAVSISSPSSNSVLSGTATLSASATDDTAVAGVWFTLDGTPIGAEIPAPPFQFSWATTSVTSGSHTLRAVARDAAGNTATSAGVPVTISNTFRDTVAPTVTLTAPAAGSLLIGTVTLSATASDNIGVVGVAFTLDDTYVSAEVMNAPYAMMATVSPRLTGPHSIRAVARDAAGNTTSSSAVVVQFGSQALASGDRTAPTVAMTSPAFGANVRGSVRLTATATDDVGVTSVQFLVDGTPIGTGTASGSSYQFTWNLGGAGLGHHFVQAVATDAAGNIATSSTLVVFVIP